jgi:hypothetical protein
MNVLGKAPHPNKSDTDQERLRDNWSRYQHTSLGQHQSPGQSVRVPLVVVAQSGRASSLLDEGWGSNPHYDNLNIMSITHVPKKFSAPKKW